MTSFLLRMIALISMAFDHTGYALFQPSVWFRQVGRISFPLFCFLLAIGYGHTRSRKQYALRLLVFALLSEVPYNLLFSHKAFLWPHVVANNVFFTLLLALAAMYCYDKLWPHQPLLAALGVMICCGVAMQLSTDYSFWGVLMSLNFYIFRPVMTPDLTAERPVCYGQTGRFWYMCIGFALGLGLYLAFLYSTRASNSWMTVQCLSALSLLPIALYNGKPGPRVLRWGFYVFYPAHLLLLYFLQQAHIVSPYLFAR